ncbi:FAD-binding oxidoreductase [Rosenbergiella metrosideri]|uniref:FAD-binding oxidoreductase n=1 Tax=Rosenbergiella metrosideri TaxID=2921185 RepID=UPI001F501C09|nr:FAD-binding oxidoreductase [Rosenbergiella metrosideri]
MSISPPITALIAQFSDFTWTVQPGSVKRLSKDFHWFSPVLKKELADKSAEAIFHPTTPQQLQQVVGACAQQAIPLTLRGAGTGNYGQLVPLAGGIVIDMTGLNKICDFGQGRARAQAGIRLAELENYTRPAGWELRCMPSTYRLATLGGLYAGGFGGIGSITYGPLAASGNVLSLTLMTVEASPQIIRLPAPQALLLHHSYGTNGILLEIEIALAPCHSWIERLDVFDHFQDALNYSVELANSPGIVKREVALFSAPIPQFFTAVAEKYRADQHAVITVIAQENHDWVAQCTERNNGKSAVCQTAEEARVSHQSLMEYCWNHTTLHAMKVDNCFTYLQTAFDPDTFPEQIATMKDFFGDEVLTHIEFLRDNHGRVTASGLQLVRFTNEARLNDIMQQFREQGIGINNPHVYEVEAGKQGIIRPEVVEMKQCYDPAGLLNPGKLRGWTVRASPYSRSAQP